MKLERFEIFNKEEHVNESTFINKGEKLKEIEIANRGDSVMIKFYNSMSSKDARLFIHKDDIQSFIDAINEEMS